MPSRQAVQALAMARLTLHYAARSPVHFYLYPNRLLGIRKCLRSTQYRSCTSQRRWFSYICKVEPIKWCEQAEHECSNVQLHWLAFVALSWVPWITFNESQAYSDNRSCQLKRYRQEDSMTDYWAWWARVGKKATATKQSVYVVSTGNSALAVAKNRGRLDEPIVSVFN